MSAVSPNYTRANGRAGRPERHHDPGAAQARFGHGSHERGGPGLGCIGGVPTMGVAATGHCHCSSVYSKYIGRSASTPSGCGVVTRAATACPRPTPSSSAYTVTVARLVGLTVR